MPKRVASAGIEVNLLAAGWLLARDEDADPGAVVLRVGQGGQASCGGPVRGGQGMGAGGAGVLPAGVSPAGGDGRRCRLPSRFPERAPSWPFCLAFGWTLAPAWGKLWAWGKL
jgi:hypothetical protein